MRVTPSGELRLAAHDLVCLAVPAGDLPAVLAAHGGRIPARAGVLVLEHGTSVVPVTRDDAFARELARVLRKSGFDVRATREDAGAESRWPRKARAA